ncbi:MAG: hypothetical protein LAQ69_14345 [Acidobacteriia bacterium]|nr:hypothetical protein [Terriglobia bacterium]
MKRTTVHVFSAGNFALTFSVSKYLKHHGVDAVLVTKHAVQVHPDHEPKAAAVLPQYRWGWDRPPDTRVPGEESKR